MDRAAKPDPATMAARPAAGQPASNPIASATISRRGLFASAAVVACAPLLAACGSSSKTSGPGTTSGDQLSKILPNYVRNTAVTPDIPSVVGANGAVSDPAS